MKNKNVYLDAQNSMPPTIYSLAAYINDGKAITPGAKADYGFDAHLYNLKGKVLTDVGVNALIKVYKNILLEKGGREKLHMAVRSNSLIELLNNYGEYNWVVYSGNLF